MKIAEETVQELRGVYGNAAVNDKYHGWVEISERSKSICMHSHYSEIYVTPAQARRLAQQLNTLARRIEKRNAPTTAEIAEATAE